MGVKVACFKITNHKFKRKYVLLFKASKTLVIHLPANVALCVGPKNIVIYIYIYIYIILLCVEKND